jgi:hypothetical protein
MIFGFNTDVSGSGAMYHVQTEDRGAKNSVIDSMVYMGGKIVERVRTSYSAEVATQAEIEEMVRAQHRQIVESIRSGTYSPSGQQSASEMRLSGYGVRLLNPEEIACDGQLRFEFCVWNRSESCAAQGAAFEVRMTPAGGDEQRASFRTGEDGKVVAAFPIPEGKAEILLLACASGGIGREVVKYSVRLNSPASRLQA